MARGIPTRWKGETTPARGVAGGSIPPGATTERPDGPVSPWKGVVAVTTTGPRHDAAAAFAPGEQVVWTDNGVPQGTWTVVRRARNDYVTVRESVHGTTVDVSPFDLTAVSYR